MDGIWIRSQDRKKLIHCKEIWVEDSSVFGSASGEEGYCRLGRYSSEERAVEVLDEIQDFLSIIRVYNMPKE